MGEWLRVERVLVLGLDGLRRSQRCRNSHGKSAVARMKGWAAAKDGKTRQSNPADVYSINIRTISILPKAFPASASTH